MSMISMKPMELGKKALVVIVLAAVLVILRIVAAIDAFSLRTRFSTEYFYFPFSFLLIPISYLGVIVFTFMRKPKLAIIFMIPTFLYFLDEFWLQALNGWHLASDTEFWIPPLRLSRGIHPSTLLGALEPLAYIAIAVLLILLIKETRAPKEALVPMNVEPTETSSTTRDAASSQVIALGSFCSSCGAPAGQGEFCSKCGGSLSDLNQKQSSAPSYATVFPRTSTMAVVALILTFFLPIIGLILGYVARGDIDRSQGTLTGRGMATAAIVINWIGIIVGAIWLFIFLSYAFS